MKYEEQPMTIALTSELLAKAGEMKNAGNRLVQVSVAATDEIYEITYTFDKDLAMKHIRVILPKGTPLPSITGVYGYAFTYENEIHDLYGIEVTGINVDFKGTFYRTKVKYPFEASVKPKEGA
ncbi:MAG: NADH-quinone oxidoreductase subunit C [Methanoregulaceae archaeon]